MARDKRDANGRPDFNVNFYVVDKRGRHAGAAVWSGSYGGTGTLTPSRFAVADASGARLKESAMGNMVADAMRGKYPGIDAAFTNSGGLRQDLLLQPPSAGEAVGEITWGEVFAVLPFGNRTTIITLTGAQLQQAFVNGFSPVCNPNVATGRFPQVSGLKATFTCSGTTAVVTGMWKTPSGQLLNTLPPCEKFRRSACAAIALSASS